MDVDRAIARLLSVGTYLGVALLALGVVGMLAQGLSPTDPVYPHFEPGTIPADVAALRPVGFLWLGLIVVIATPLARVVAALVAYLRQGDRRMAAISVAILAVIALAVVLGLGEA